MTQERVTRREVIKRGLIGAAGLAALPAVLAACGDTSVPSLAGLTPPPPRPTPVPTTSAPTPSPTPEDFLARELTGGLTVGNLMYTSPNQVKGLAAVDAAFESETGLTLTVNRIEPGTYANPIQEFLTTTPSDAFFWWSGSRTRSIAVANLVPVDDVWRLVSGNSPAGLARALTGDDGRVYGIPIGFYPWGVFYRKSVWAARGYTVPTTWTEFLALCARMKKDRLTPIAFGDKDGWPATGTFDILNLRLNGYDFHMDLMSGKAKWTDLRVTAVFEAWRRVLPFCSIGSTALRWQDACDMLTRKTAGMYYTGTFLTGQVAAVDRAAVEDLDFFPFPYFGNSFDSEKAIEAPIDMITIPAKSPTLAADLVNAKAYLEFWARGSTQLHMYQADHGLIPTALDVDRAQLDALSRKAVSMLDEAKRVSQFMDRDTRPDFAGPSGMQAQLIRFIEKPDQELATLQMNIQEFWDGLPAFS
jgi:multiple sugar transport system substrate-binding protein